MSVVCGVVDGREVTKRICKYDTQCAHTECYLAHSSLYTERKVRYYEYCTYSRETCNDARCELNHRKEEIHEICALDKNCTKKFCKDMHSNLFEESRVSCARMCKYTVNNCKNPFCSMNHFRDYPSKKKEQRYVCRDDKECNNTNCIDLHSNHCIDSRVRIEAMCNLDADECREPMCEKSHKVPPRQSKKRSINEEIIRLFDSEQEMREENLALKKNIVILEHQISTLQATLNHALQSHLHCLINHK